MRTHEDQRTVSLLVEDYNDWADRHGGRAVAYQGTHHLFPDGAICDDLGNGRREPPADKAERMKLEYRYWGTLAEILDADYSRWSKALLHPGRYAPVNLSQLRTPGVRDVGFKDDVSVLEWLAAELARARAQLRRVEEQLAPPPRPPEDPTELAERAEWDRLAAEAEERTQRERDERIRKAVAVAEGVEDVPDDPTAPPATPGRALTIDPYDVSPVRAPE